MENVLLFLRNSRELGFLCDCIIKACPPNVLLRTLGKVYVYDVVDFNFYFDGWQQLKDWAYKVSYDKTKNLSLTSVILKGRKTSMVFIKGVLL